MLKVFPLHQDRSNLSNKQPKTDAQISVYSFLVHKKEYISTAVNYRLTPTAVPDRQASSKCQARSFHPDKIADNFCSLISDLLTSSIPRLIIKLCDSISYDEKIEPHKRMG